MQSDAKERIWLTIYGVWALLNIAAVVVLAILVEIAYLIAVAALFGLTILASIFVAFANVGRRFRRA